jgi:predicted metalloendopeptidase
MFEKLPHLPFLFQENSAERREILGHTPSQLTGDFYAACMDESRVNALVLKPLESMLKGIEGVHDARSLSAEIYECLL